MLHNAMAEDHLGLDVRNGAFPGERIIALEGVLNLNTAMQFRDCVRENAAGTLVLDMSPRPLCGFHRSGHAHRRVCVF